MRLKAMLRSAYENIKKIQLSTQRHYPSPETLLEIATLFNHLYYDAYNLGKTWADTRFLGMPAGQIVSDLWVYQGSSMKDARNVIV